MREFVAHVIELMQPWGSVSARRMFGGHGLYRDGTFFALIIDDTLYLKADDETRERFTAAGSRPFVYDKRRAGRRVETSYWSAPAACLDSAPEMAAWCELALAAALRKTQAPVRRRTPTARRSR
jgi:DNA transformation protein and related proteins